VTSEVSICNLALYHVGESRITSLSEDSTGARLCNEFYAPMRDAVLEDRDWKFAGKRQQLGLLAAAPAFGYAYRHQIPADCIKVRDVRRDTLENDRPNDLEWVREGDVILSDATPLYLRYTYRETNPNKFSSGFVTTLAYRLASSLAIPIQQSRTLQDQMWNLYQQALQAAGQSDGQQGTARKLNASKLSDVRGRGTTRLGPYV
jgi:hypothetical protein